MKTNRNKTFVKNSVAALFICVFFMACSSNESSNTQADAPEQSEQTESVEAKDVQPEAEPAGSSGGSELDIAMEKGKAVFEKTCIACHQANGEGIPGSFPPLAKADYLLADKERAILQTMMGSPEPITVNGITYPGGVMPPQNLDDEQIANVMTYVLNSWGNEEGLVTEEEVKKIREGKNE